MRYTALCAFSILSFTALAAEQSRTLELGSPSPGERMKFSYDTRTHYVNPTVSFADSRLRETFDIDVLSVRPTRFVKEMQIEWTLRSTFPTGYYRKRESFYGAFVNVPLKLTIDPRGGLLPMAPAGTHIYISNFDDIRGRLIDSTPNERGREALQHLGSPYAQEAWASEAFLGIFSVMHLMQMNERIEIGHANRVEIGHNTVFDILGVDTTKCLVQMVETNTIPSKTAKQRLRDDEISAWVSTADGWITSLDQRITTPSSVEDIAIRRLTPNPCRPSKLR